jgi:transcriptional regulator with XRE-family HTH domain
MVKNKLLEIRLQMGYRFQKDFAEHLEISQYQYNRYEKNINQPSLEVLLDICGPEKLNIDPREIFYLVKD